MKKIAKFNHKGGSIKNYHEFQFGMEHIKAWEKSVIGGCRLAMQLNHVCIRC